ncbi:hypothetical protein FACS1894103_4840 [Campylobacterota bacterium]|nr:hypothetical protein FACS1894103_4840 [Campylobacterota bacterium]
MGAFEEQLFTLMSGQQIGVTVSQLTAITGEPKNKITRALQKLKDKNYVVHVGTIWQVRKIR